MGLFKIFSMLIREHVWVLANCNMTVYFLFEEPVNQILLFRTSKDDIVRRAGKDQPSKMLQSVLKLITKVRFVVLTNSTSTSYVLEYVSSLDPEVGKHRWRNMK